MAFERFAARGLALAGLLACRGAHAEGPLPTLTVTIAGLRSDQGQVACELFLGPKGYPTKPDLAVQKRLVPIAQHLATCVFPRLTAGAYAVAVFHDENGNGKLDTNFLGIPREGLAASNDAKGSFGPPSFEAARLELGQQDIAVTVHVRY